MSAVAMYSSVQVGGIDEQVLQHAPLVKRIAYHLLSKLPNSVQVDDLIQAGMLGLLEALRNYDLSKGASFDTYAGIRIRGSMLDEVRRCDWVPRSVYKKSRTISDAIRVIENETGCAAKDAEVAEYLNMSLDEYHHILQDSNNCRVFSIEELSQTGDNYLEESSSVNDTPLESLTLENFQSALSAAIAALPERERLIISLYYDEELNLREIGKILNLTESRVSQISSQAVLRLRSRLGGWLNND